MGIIKTALDPILSTLESLFQRPVDQFSPLWTLLIQKKKVIVITTSSLFFVALLRKLYRNLIPPKYVRHLPILGPLDTVPILLKHPGFLESNKLFRNRVFEIARGMGLVMSPKEHIPIHCQWMYVLPFTMSTDVDMVSIPNDPVWYKWHT
jgi:hypothetical protein